jgi:hypothetical protein
MQNSQITLQKTKTSSKQISCHNNPKKNQTQISRNHHWSRGLKKATQTSRTSMAAK